MMIDLSTIQSMELIQNLQDAKSKDCLFGLMNETLTPMGSRLLRSSILQPSTQREVLTQRWDAMTELSENADIFLQIRQGAEDILPTTTHAKFVQRWGRYLTSKSCLLVYALSFYLCVVHC